MQQNNLTKITPELAEDIIRYTKSKYSHVVTSVRGLKGGIFETEYNNDFIYYDRESFEVLKAAGKNLKSKSNDAPSKVG